jgi:hypothetical protein
VFFRTEHWEAANDITPHDWVGFSFIAVGSGSVPQGQIAGDNEIRSRVTTVYLINKRERVQV